MPGSVVSNQKAALDRRFFRIPRDRSFILLTLRGQSKTLRHALPFRFAFAGIAMFLFSVAPFIRAVDTTVPRPNPSVPNSIVIGFVGGFVRHDNPHHGPVKVAQRIRRIAPPNTYVRVFENRRRKQALQTVLTVLDTNRDGILSPEEKTAARIILFGHSWGASSTIMLARDLRQQGIPVLLTVQVDSVAKLWQNDSIVPDNVAEAINFYQTQGFIHGRRQISASDPARTEILGNYRMDYKKDPVFCPEASRWERVFTPGHMQSECDPNLWGQVETMVEQRLRPPHANVSNLTTDTTQTAR